jgi:glutamate formiminotransferase / formiminotetrahydrofolate cyclodeaminase
MTKRILECVPNFSEGRDKAKVEAIAAEIEQVKGVRLLHVDMGFDANRTVMTFAGAPEAVVEAAFRAVKKAAEVIDMRYHLGVHPRFGATDVLPLVPVNGITIDETVILAHGLARRIGEELGIHVYCYEHAALEEKRRNLANCRAGEYEGLPVKISTPGWHPDFGPHTFNAQSGAVAVGARNFLIAYNINLETSDLQVGKEIAFEIRESGKWIETTDPSGAKEKIHKPGLLKGVKAIGWFLPHHQKVQVSTNITNIDLAPVHVLFEKVKEVALRHSTDVTGSELIGLIPLRVMLEAGKFYALQANLPGFTTDMLIQKAIENLKLEEFGPFDYQTRILELALAH